MSIIGLVPRALRLFALQVNVRRQLETCRGYFQRFKAVGSVSHLFSVNVIKSRWMPLVELWLCRPSWALHQTTVKPHMTEGFRFILWSSAAESRWKIKWHGLWRNDLLKRGGTTCMHVCVHSHDNKDENWHFLAQRAHIRGLLGRALLNNTFNVIAQWLLFVDRAAHCDPHKNSKAKWIRK